MKIVRVPFRVSLIGGGTDIEDFYSKYGGQVIGGAISLYNYILVRPLLPFFDYQSRFSYRKIEEVKHFDEIEHRAIKATIEYLGLQNFPLELHNSTDAPANSGLGTSSAFTVGLVTALKGYSNRYIENAWKTAINIERVILNEKGGIQDQILCGTGGLNHIKIWQEKVSIDSLPIEGGLEDHLLLLYTKKRRISSDVARSYKKLDEEPALIKLNEYTDLALKCLKQKDYIHLGYLMGRSWDIKKGLSPLVSDGQIDEWHRIIMKNAWGAKLCGSGGGGTFLVVCRPDKREQIIKETGLLELPFKFVEKGAEILYESTN